MRALAVLAGALASITILATGYLATFDGSPATPLSYQSGHFLDGMDVQVHDRGMNANENSLDPMQAGHGDDCSPPPATHQVDGSRAASVFQCRDHFMTALNGANYGVIYITPPAMVDFSTQGRITFEVSTEDTSPRDWWDVTVSPFGDSQALPLLSALSQGVDLQGPNRNAVMITTDNGEGRPHAVVVRGGVDSGLPDSGALPGTGVTAGTNQAATRQTFELTLTPSHVRFARLASTTAPALTYVDADIAPLAWSTGVVQLGHHSYVPTKCSGCTPQTWHWDNLSIEPFVNLGILPVSPKYTDAPTMLTHAPAPAGAYLRFSAICQPIIDGVAGVKMTDIGHPEHFASYLMPIAEGSTSHTLGFRADGWYSGPCAYKDGSVFSQGGAPSTPTASATSTPSSTTTSTPSPSPTATSSPSPTSTPSATVTATPTVTSSPTTTPSPTPSPDTRRYRCQVQSRPGAAWVVLGTPSAGGVACP